jgi:hypothetical protein
MNLVELSFGRVELEKGEKEGWRDIRVIRREKDRRGSGKKRFER